MAARGVGGGGGEVGEEVREIGMKKKIGAARKFSTPAITFLMVSP